METESSCSPYSRIINEFGHLFSLVIKSIKIISLKNSLAYQLIITWVPHLNNWKMFFSCCHLDRPFITYICFLKIYWILPFRSFASSVGRTAMFKDSIWYNRKKRALVSVRPGFDFYFSHLLLSVYFFVKWDNAITLQKLV